jgi:4-amino-4-deoxy-L-arabinose transferase-like glycosyltransferase
MRTAKWHAIAIVLIAFGFFMVGLNRLPVPTVDGAVRASMARNIVRTGQIWPITYEGRVFADHPPLYVWLSAVSFKIFGVTDFAANLPQHLFAFLLVVVTGLIAAEVGLGSGAALAAALILCLTRDFVLSSVRGYIEPLLEFWIYLGIWFALVQRRSKRFWPSLAAGACIWLAAFSKGPVALWPFLFCGYLIFRHENRRQGSRKWTSLTAFFGATALLTLIWATWVQRNHFWPYWQQYFFHQVLGSALEGRGGAQQFEPLYFVKILLKFYWPWLPLLVFALWRFFKLPLHIRELAVFGFGFVGAFSLMKWKFWYYIAPAYPAFAIVIASVLPKSLSLKLNKPAFARAFAAVAALWILIGSAFPIPLHHERVPEVLAFKDAIHDSTIPGPVWYLRDPMDHNMIGTSGNWYFDRIVEKVPEEEEGRWEQQRLHSPAWIITGADFYKTCMKNWCRQARFVSTAGKSALLRY